MTFTPLFAERLSLGNVYGELYTFTGTGTETGGTINTGLREIIMVKMDGNKSDGSTNLLTPSAGRTDTARQVRVAYANPNAAHNGYVLVIGRY